MKVETKHRKKAMAGFRQMSSEEQRRQQMHEIIQNGTRALNQVSLDLGRQLAEYILYSEREELAGPDYQPRKEGLYNLQDSLIVSLLNMFLEVIFLQSLNILENVKIYHRLNHANICKKSKAVVLCLRKFL